MQSLGKARNLESNGDQETKGNMRNMQKKCGTCGTLHDQTKRKVCPAHGKICLKCSKGSHYVSKCRSNKRDHRSDNKDIPVRTVDGDNRESGVFCADMISAVDLDDVQLVTLKLESGNYLRFQPDTGAQCNVILVDLYKKASKDDNLQHVTPFNSPIAAYGGSKGPVVGQERIAVWRDDYKCKLDCKLVDNNKLGPLLGRKACTGMKIIEYKDNDALIKLEETTMEEVSNALDDTVDPVKHAPRRVPVTLRAKVKEALEYLVKQEVNVAVTCPTAWISSMVNVPKKNGKLGICLDPRDPNHAVQHEHYPLSTIEDIANRLHGAKVFTRLDARNLARGFR